MRVTFVLLAAIAISTSYAATNAQPTSISAKMPTGMVNSIDVGPDDANEKRFLRTNRVADDGDDEEKDDDGEEGIDDDEERYKAWKIKDLIDGRTVNIFGKWKRNGYSLEHIRNKLKKLKENGKLTKDNVDDILRWYQDA